MFAANDSEFKLPAEERVYLRELAARQAEIAALPVMEQRKKMWFAVNTGNTDATPPVVIEERTFDRDFLPDTVLTCTSALGRSVEKQLLRQIRRHELIDDDQVTPDTFDIGWFVEIDEFGFQIERVSVEDSQGVKTAYQSVHPITDLERDIEKLSPAVCSVDRDRTRAWQGFLDELLGDLLPVVIRSNMGVYPFLTHRIIPLMGMEAFFLSMYECPDTLHRLMAYLRDNALSIMRWYEREDLLVVNNGNQESFGSSYNFTDRLPAPGFDPDHVRLSDMWLSSNSQETVGVSPEGFGEFCYPYYREVCEPMGLLYYGCCEPAHPFWEYIGKLPHLAKVSISRWCDERFMGERLRGGEIVYSRKPDPNFLSVDKILDEDAWRAHIRTTLEATDGVPLEFIVRDVYTVHGDLRNPRRAVEIARAEIGRHRS